MTSPFTIAAMPSMTWRARPRVRRGKAAKAQQGERREQQQIKTDESWIQIFLISSKISDEVLVDSIGT